MLKLKNKYLCGIIIGVIILSLISPIVISKLSNQGIISINPPYNSNPSHEMTSAENLINFADPGQQFTRGSVRGLEKEPNDIPRNATSVNRASIAEIEGTISSGTDVDWFKMKLEVHESSSGSLTDIETFNITNIVISGDTDYDLGIFIYGVYDINQNYEIDFNTELILMNCSTFRIGQSYQEELSINSYISEYYYIKIITDGGIADYRFRLNYKTGPYYIDKNQDMKYATTFAPETTHVINMGLDTFDWFYERKLPPKDAHGINFSITVEIDDYYNRQPLTIDGVSYYFVTILHMLVYHESKIVGNKPVFPYQFRDHVLTSKNTQAKLPKEIVYSDVVTLPTHLYTYTYLGFFLESYCVLPALPGEKFYPLKPELEEYIQNTYCSFTIQEKNSESFKRPELSKVSVVSTSTKTIFGKTYDTYRYSVTYSQENNNRPLNIQISIFTLTGEMIDEMKKITVGGAAQNIWRTGCKYEYTFSGLELGEGNHHVFQFHFRDKNAFANGTIEVGKTWHGPYISNNIEPFVRPSAPSNITLYEDDNTTFFNMFNIFEDVDLQDELNFTFTDPKLEPTEMEWVTEWSTYIAEISIVNQSRLKIEPKPNKNGEVEILLNLTDKKSFYANYKLAIIIIPVNDPPQFLKYFSSIVLNEDEIYTDINMADYIIDIIDDEKLDYWAEIKEHIKVEIEDNNDVKIIPEPNWYGTEYVFFYGSDGKETVSDFLKVIVRSINDPPKLIINSTIELYEDMWANFTINAFDTADNETVLIGHNLTEIFPVLLKSPKRYGYTFDNLTGFITIKPVNNMVGMYSWNVSSVDINNVVNFTHVTLIIHNVNDPPYAEITFPKNGARYLTTDKISFRGLGSDVDSTLKESYFTWYSILDGNRSKIGSGRALPPLLYEDGYHRIILTVTDGEYYYNASITITVYSINQNLDTDKDEIPDYWENLYFFNIHDPNDATDDPDTDTYSNWEEYKAGTDPNDPNSMPEKHIYREGEAGNVQDYTWLIWFSIAIIIFLVLVLLFFTLKVRKKRKLEEQEKLSTEGIIGMSPGPGGGKHGSDKLKTPKVVCHRCGKSLEVLTLNRPLVVTCTDCGARGVVYK